jgi:hypothetical protein
LRLGFGVKESRCPSSKDDEKGDDGGSKKVIAWREEPNHRSKRPAVWVGDVVERVPKIGLKATAIQGYGSIPLMWLTTISTTNYIFSGKEYPLERRDETQLEENGRRGIVREWRDMLTALPATPKQNANILNMLFYAT